MSSTYAMAKSYALASLQILMVLLIASSAQSAILTTEFTFYAHEYFSGSNASVAAVAGVDNPPQAGKFGTIVVAYNRITEGISEDSQTVGYLQGIAAVASLDGSNAEGLTSMQFTSGEYNASTVELKGLTLPIPVNEYAIVGGTQKFRYATGYANFENLHQTDDYLLFRFSLHIKQDLRFLEEGNRKKASM